MTLCRDLTKGIKKRGARGKAIRTGGKETKRSVQVARGRDRGKELTRMNSFLGDHRMGVTRRENQV